MQILLNETTTSFYQLLVIELMLPSLYHNMYTLERGMWGIEAGNIVITSF